MNDQIILSHLSGQAKTAEELKALTGLTHTQLYEGLVHLESAGKAYLTARHSDVRNGLGMKRIALWEATA